jgi:hypothetical protein
LSFLDEPTRIMEKKEEKKKCMAECLSLRRAAHAARGSIPGQTFD